MALAIINGRIQLKTNTPEATLYEAQPHPISSWPIFLTGILFFWLVIPFIFAAYEYYRLKSTKYIITSQRVICESGIFTKTISQVELYRLRDIQLSENIFQHLFAVETISLYSNDRTTPVLQVDSIANGRDLLETIRSATESLRDTKRRIY